MTSLLRDFVTQPLAWVALMLLCALWRSRTPSLQAGRHWLAGALLLLLVGWLPLPQHFMHELETSHEANTRALADYAGVLVLGGSFSPDSVQSGRSSPQLNANAERLTQAVALARSNPELRMVFTGGCAGPDGCRSEADMAREFFKDMGLAPDRFEFEGTSRNTFENARNTAKLEGLDRSEPWLLLTSAWHMRRALATFRAQGWNVTPLPVDFRGAPHPNWSSYSLGQGVEYWQLLLHEWLGLFAYRVAEKA